MVGMIWDMLYIVDLYDGYYIFCSVSFHFWVAQYYCGNYEYQIDQNYMNQCYWKLSTKYFLCWNFFPKTIVLNNSVLVWSRSRVIDIIWKNMLYNKLSYEWGLKIVYQQNFPVEKKMVFRFLAKVFPSSFAVNLW